MSAEQELNDKDSKLSGVISVQLSSAQVYDLLNRGQAEVSSPGLRIDLYFTPVWDSFHEANTELDKKKVKAYADKNGRKKIPIPKELTDEIQRFNDKYYPLNKFIHARQ